MSPPAHEGAKNKLAATYQLPYWKHAPIGPTMALADYRPDGSVTVHTHTQNAQALRGQLAMMLGTSVDKVTVKTYPGAGHYGRSNGGNAGAEDEAVLLSKEVGKPVRVQWMRDDDMKWSTQSAAAYADVNISLDEHGRIAAYEIDHYQPAMQDDRLIGAVLAGLPTMPAPSEKGGPINNIANGSSDDVALRCCYQSRRTLPRDVPGWPAKVSTGGGPARSQHAHPRPVSAELSPGNGDE